MPTSRRPRQAQAEEFHELDKHKVKVARVLRYGADRGEVDGKSFLERHTVQPATADDYRKRVERWQEWAVSAGLGTQRIQDIDDSVVAWMEEAYFEGEPAAEASKMMAALGYWLPQLTRGAPELTRSHDAARGWRRLAPGRTRMPTPWPVVAWIVEWLVFHRMVESAVATALCFTFMLRPSEVLRVRRRDLVPPPAVGPRSRQKWSLILHPVELAVTSKVGENDEALPLDNPEFAFMAEVLRRRRVPPLDEPFVALLYNQWTSEYRKATEALKLERLGPPTLYGLRHGAASHEALTGFRDGLALARRGRWRGERSVRRYEKGGRISQVLAELTDQQSAAAHAAEESVGLTLALRC